MEETLAIASYNNPDELLRDWRYLMFVCIEKPSFLANKMWLF